MAIPSEFALISICAGVGGLDLGVSLAAEFCGFATRVVCYVEIESYAAALLAKRMEEGLLSPAPIWTDVKTFPGIAEQFRGKVHGIIAGYPCQPFSAAGARRGTSDPRHLFPYIRRTVRTVEPLFCFFENVRGHLSLGFDVVQRCLRRDGYRVEPGIFSAAEVGASHRRERLFILAYRQHEPRRTEQWPQPRKRSGTSPAYESMSDGTGPDYFRLADSQRPERWPETESGVCRDERTDSARESASGTGERSGVLEHAKSVTRRGELEQGEQGEHRRSGPSGASRNVADTRESGLEGRQLDNARREREREREPNRNHLDQLPNFVTHIFLSSHRDQTTMKHGEKSLSDGPNLRQLWPTATVQSQAQTRENPTPGQTGGTTLAGAVMTNWPTPTGEDSEQAGAFKKRDTLNSLTKQGKKKLNPNFVDWLMGFPPGWTSVLTDFGPEEMQLWRCKQVMHLSRLLGRLD